MIVSQSLWPTAPEFQGECNTANRGCKATSPQDIGYQSSNRTTMWRRPVFGSIQAQLGAIRLAAIQWNWLTANTGGTCTAHVTIAARVEVGVRNLFESAFALKHSVDEFSKSKYS